MRQTMIRLLLLGCPCSVGYGDAAMRLDFGSGWKQERDDINRQAMTHLNWKLAKCQ